MRAEEASGQVFDLGLLANLLSSELCEEQLGSTHWELVKAGFGAEKALQAPESVIFI